MNQFRKQYSTKQQLWGHLPPITQTIQIRHAKHYWRSKDKLISDVLEWNPTQRHTSVVTMKNYFHQLSANSGAVCNLLDKERNPGHSSIITGWNGGRRKKSNDWPIDQTPSFSLAEIWKRKFSSRQTLARDRRQFSQLRWISRKKSRTESLDRSQC